jgi:hypothetical protein
MKAKFIYEEIKDILKSKELSPDLQKRWDKIQKWKDLQRKEQLTLDDIYDELNQEQQEYVDSILSHSGEIKGLYYDGGGWNGMMDSINEVEERYKIESPDFENFQINYDIDVMQLIVKAL